METHAGRPRGPCPALSCAFPNRGRQGNTTARLRQAFVKPTTLTPAAPLPSGPLLALETATDVCAVAILAGGRIVAEAAVRRPQQHGALLAPLVREVLGWAGLAPADVAAVAVSAGPGSYTGLRIGAATAKGFAAALGVPLVAVPTLDALAREAAPAAAALAPGAVLVAVLPSRRGEVYAAAYRLAPGAPDPAGPSPLRDAAGLAVGDVPAWLGADGPAVLAGDGAARLAPFFPDALALAADRAGPDAAAVARLGAARLAAGHVEDLAAWEPAYLKPWVPGA